MFLSKFKSIISNIIFLLLSMSLQTIEFKYLRFRHGSINIAKLSIPFNKQNKFQAVLIYIIQSNLITAFEIFTLF